jgi:5-methyltetrahydrofolate--homocysteine methyltransferase
MGEHSPDQQTDGIRAKGIARRLGEGEILVADGAMGTMLMAAGLEQGVPPELWNVEFPERILEVQRAYVRAGAQIILTNTFGGSRINLERTGRSGQTSALNRAGATLARKAAGDRAYVAGDIGPCGELMAPLGTLTFEQAVENFGEQASLLAACGVDALWVETMTDLEEARAAVTGAGRAASLPVFCTLSFGRSGRTMMGVSARQALDTLLPLDVTALGANCGEGLEAVDTVLAELHELAPDLPLIAKPNAGLPVMAEGRLAYDMDSGRFAEQITACIKRGARVVGGCCGSNPEYIAAIARAIGSPSAPAD